MIKEKTFSEMLHGDIRWMKEQEAVRRMRRLGKTEMVLLDAELANHYEAQDTLLESLRGRRGFGRGMTLKVELIAATKAKAEINKRNPALAAEHRVDGMKAERSIALELKRLRDWKKLNWAYYYGRGNQFDENSVMRLT